MKKLAALFATLAAIPALAQNTGVYTGTYNFSVTIAACSNKTFSTNGNVTLVLLQTGTAVSGRMDLTNFVSVDSNCNATNFEATTAIIGNASGGSIAWTVPNDSSGAQFTGNAGDTMSVQWTDAAGATGTLTLNKVTGAAPSTNVTGAWSGTYNFVDQCSSSTKFPYTGPVTLTITQTGANAGGVMTMQNVPLYDANCRQITTLTQSMSVAGTVTDSTFTGAVFDPSGLFDFPLTATLGNASISGSVQGANSTNTTGTFTLTQSSTALPPSDRSGTYTGSYTETDNTSAVCLNIGSLTFSGPASLSITHAGSDVSGWMTFSNARTVSSDGFGNCIVANAGDETLPVYGTIANGALTVTAPFGGTFIRTTFSFSGDSVSANLVDQAGDVATMTGTRASLPRLRRRAVRP